MKPATKEKMVIAFSRFLWIKLHIHAVPSLKSKCEYCGLFRKDFFPIVVFMEENENKVTFYRRVVKTCKRCGAPLVTITFYKVIDVTNEFMKLKEVNHEGI